jgi:hypothetical protein
MTRTTTSASSAVRRTGLSAVAFGLVAAPVILMPSMASALPETDPECGTTTPAATLVAPGVCEVVFTESGTFTAPSGISKLAAFMVGAGAGGWGSINSFGSYGGGAGEVVYVDSVEFSNPLEVTVGIGGYFEQITISGAAPELGGDTSVGGTTALGGFPTDQFSGGTSGNGYAGGDATNCDMDSTVELSSGGGGASSAANGFSGGAGLVLSDFADVDTTLFPALDSETVYGAGGDSCSTEVTVANTGNGGSASNSSGENGSDGVVIFRYAALSDGVEPITGGGDPITGPAATVLAKTGPAAEPMFAAGAASALFAAGAALLVMVRRSRKNA